MTKRAKQHQLEDLSRTKFNLAMPRNWVCRDKDKDYGIDVEVEVFDEKGRATGLVFWVQLKATESDRDSIIRKIDLSIETLKYYQTLEIPVLIARYSETEDRFYCTWANDIDLFYAKEGAKTIRVTFDEQGFWDEKSPSYVKGYLEKVRAIKNGRITFPIPIHLDIKDEVVNGIPKDVLISSYRDALAGYLEFALLCDDPKDSLLMVTISGDDLNINLSSLGHCTFHSIKSRKAEGLAESIVVDSLVGSACALAQVGQHEMSARLVLDKRLKSRFVQKQDMMIYLIPFLLSTSFFGEIIDLINEIIDSENNNFIEAIVQANYLYGAKGFSEEKLAKIEEFLEKCIEKYSALGEDLLTGIAFYNLGNHYRSRNLFNKAISHYFKARRYKRNYVDQPYYLQELAGTLFLYEKYCLSSILYKMALDKGASQSVIPLYADALMHSGKYQLALDTFGEYLKTSEGERDDEWHLKHMCLGELIKASGIREQTRRRKEALALIDISDAKSFEKALKIDMLCGLAWFNSGVEHSKASQNEQAVFDFIMCGLVQTGDIQAWVNAALCCFNKELPVHLMPLIIRTGYAFNGDKFLSKLYQEFNDQTNPDICGELASLIEGILPQQKNSKDDVEFRLLGEDGEVYDTCRKG